MNLIHGIVVESEQCHRLSYKIFFILYCEFFYHILDKKYNGSNSCWVKDGFINNCATVWYVYRNRIQLAIIVRRRTSYFKNAKYTIGDKRVKLLFVGTWKIFFFFLSGLYKNEKKISYAPLEWKCFVCRSGNMFFILFWKNSFKLRAVYRYNITYEILYPIRSPTIYI